MCSLRSPYETVGGIVALARTLDKIRLFHAGKLPSEYHAFLGTQKSPTLDGAVCHFLQVSYDALREKTLTGASDEEILTWVFAQSRTPSEGEIEVFNAARNKRGWRDETSEVLRQRVTAAGFSPDEVLTWADFLDMDEGRPLRFPPDPAPPARPVRSTAIIPGLRSPYEKLGGIVHFPRMLDKIRLAEKGTLPPAWCEMRGAENGYDGMTCRFLNVKYTDIEHLVLNGKSDEEVAAWVKEHGRTADEFEISCWNSFLTKRGWRDIYTPRLHTRLREAGMPPEAALVMFDFLDLDEGRPLRFGR